MNEKEQLRQIIKERISELNSRIKGLNNFDEYLKKLELEVELTKVMLEYVKVFRED